MNHTIFCLILDFTENILQSTVPMGTALGKLLLYALEGMRCTTIYIHVGLNKKIFCKINTQRNNLVYSKNIRAKHRIIASLLYFLMQFKKIN